jgi:hypothetical protein
LLLIELLHCRTQLLHCRTHLLLWLMCGRSASNIRSPRYSGGDVRSSSPCCELLDGHVQGEVVDGWCWAEIEQFALEGSSNSLHSGACNALGASKTSSSRLTSCAACCCQKEPKKQTNATHGWLLSADGVRLCRC